MKVTFLELKESNKWIKEKENFMIQMKSFLLKLEGFGIPVETQSEIIMRNLKRKRGQTEIQVSNYVKMKLENRFC